MQYFPNKEYDTIIDHYALLYNVSPDIVRAICYVESRFDPSAVSSRGAIGLMQILPETGRWIVSLLDIEEYSDQQLFLPDINIRIGCYYISYLYSRFDEEWCVFAAYNAGEGRVSEWIERDINEDSIPFPETKRYVRKVSRVSHIYGNKKILSFY